MQWHVVFILFITLLFLVDAQMVWAAFILGLLIVLYVFSGFMGGAGRVAHAIGSGAKKDFTREWGEVENAKPKPPSGEFISEATHGMAERFGNEAIAKSNEPRGWDEKKGSGVLEWLGNGSANLLEGIRKLFRKEF